MKATRTEKNVTAGGERDELAGSTVEWCRVCGKTMPATHGVVHPVCLDAVFGQDREQEKAS